MKPIPTVVPVKMPMGLLSSGTIPKTVSSVVQVMATRKSVMSATNPV